MNDAEANEKNNNMTNVKDESIVDGSVMSQKAHTRSSKSKRNKKPRRTMKQRGKAILDNIQNAPIYWGLFAFNLLVLFCFGGMSFSSEINENFLLSPSTVAEKPWTIVTSAFMHVGILHFVINMYALKSFLNLDKSKDAPKDLTKGYVITYVLSIFAAGLFVILFSDPNMNTAGASGAIFGIFGAMITHHRFAEFRTALIITLAINIGISFGLSMISWQAHMGGLALGLIAGCVMNWIDFKGRYKREKVEKSDSVLAKFIYENTRNSMLFFNPRAQERMLVINTHLEKGVVIPNDIEKTLEKFGGEHPGQLNVRLFNVQLEKQRAERDKRSRIQDEWYKQKRNENFEKAVKSFNNRREMGITTKVEVDESYSEFYDGDGAGERS